MKKLSLFSVIVIVFALQIGCAYNPGPDYTPGKTIPPKAGSTFIFKSVQTDTLGVPIDSTIYYYKDSVAETGTLYQGKTNVTHFISIDTLHGFTSDSYINYETNGDISTYVGGFGGFGGVTLPPWRTYPVQSHTTTGAKIADTSLTLPGIPLPVHFVGYDTMTFIGNGTYPVSGKIIPVFNAKEVLTITASALIISMNVNTVTHIEFAPSLGYIVSQITDPTKIPAFIPSQGGSRNTLTAYILK